MVYLILAIICSSLVSIVMRISERYVRGDYGMLAVNYMICTIVAASYSGVNNLFPKTAGINFTLGLGICTGVLYLAGLLLVKLNISRNGVVLTTIFQKLGLLVQLLIAIVFFKESPGVVQIIGIILCLAAVILINAEKTNTVIPFKTGLILILVISGICDGMSKVHEEMGNIDLSEHFLLYTFGTAVVISIILLLKNREKPEWKELIFGILLGVPNLFASGFLLKSLNDIAAVVVFPTYSVATVVVVAIIGLLIFKEKLSKKQWTAMGMILVALGLLNV